MKKLINRRTGKELTIDEARALARKIEAVEHRAVFGYPTEELAKKATLNSILETYADYIFAYIGTESLPFEGYMALIIACKKLPDDFEKRFPNYVVIG